MKKQICPECGGNVKYSKLEYRRYICKECNGVFDFDKIKTVEVKNGRGK